MRNNWFKPGIRLVALGGAAALLISGCTSDGGGDSGATGDVGAVGQQDKSGDPVDGGNITFGSYGFPSSMDPTQTPASGFTGGTEMAAIYDTLVRTNSETQDFEPQLAKSLDSNDDFTKFTITLPADAKFSDGTPVDAEAVKWSIDRFVDGQADVAQEWSNAVSTISTPDDDTVVFELIEPWRQFPVLLAMGPGMIVAKASDEGERFTPIGAGPFEMTKFAADEELVLAAREDYFNGRPHLDTVRFVPTNGARAQLESLNSGQLDMAILYRDEEAIRDAKDAGFNGYLDIQGLGSLAMINNREGRPGSDVRVRQAVAYGIDPVSVNERTNSGLGVADSAIFPESSRWYAGNEGVAFDPEKAKELLEEAKADGYDGKLNYLSTTEPSAEASALAIQAALNSIGFDVVIDYAGSVTDMVRKLYVEQDFDIVRSGDGLMDEDPYLRLYSSVGSESQNNASGYADAEMDALLDKVKTSTSDEETEDALAKIQERFNETVPYAILGPSKIFVAWNSDIRGAHRSVDNMVLFDSAWIDEG